MKLEKVSLFTKGIDFFKFLLFCLFILCYSLLIEYQNFKSITRFDTALVDAIVIKQYEKTKDSKSYQVLKLKSEQGFVFYTTVKKNIQNLVGKKLSLEISTKHITFSNFFTYFYAYSYIKSISQTKTLKNRLNAKISDMHEDKNISNIYQALYTATTLNKDLQGIFSSLGVSHLVAISGFHLGIISALLLFLLKYPYQFLQDRFFPYRNSNRDIFIVISFILLSYLLFLDSPPSLLRAFFMLIIGFVLYDRGIKIVSMQTLVLTIMILLSFSPRLFFSLGFWLSIIGVFYIFLFLMIFKNFTRVWQFVFMPIWLYLMMLPFSLSIFGNFSIYHPLSIVWTIFFSAFYPLSIFLHFVGLGDYLDFLLHSFITLNNTNIKVDINNNYLYLHIFLSFLSLWKKQFSIVLLVYSLFLLMFNYLIFL